MKKDDLLYLDHILESFIKISGYLEGVSYEQFLQNQEKQDAVIRNIEIAGEATKKLSPELRQQYSEIDWRAIAGMRDKLIHDYFDVDLEIVWVTTKEDIPGLVEKIRYVQQAYLDKE